MITELARKHGVLYRGKLVMPINTCAHCGKEDDPESAWAQDDDGDQLCLDCAELRCTDCDSIEAGSCFYCKQD